MIRTSILRGRLVALGSAIFAAATLLSTPAFAGKPGGGGGGGGGSTCTSTIPVVDTYNGRATDIDLAVTVLGGIIAVGPLKISDTGELGPTTAESEKESHLATVDLPLPPPPSVAAIRVQAGILDAVTKSMGNLTTSNARVAGLNLVIAHPANPLGILPPVLSVGASVIEATAKAMQTQPAACAAGSGPGSPVGTTAYSGSSTIVDLAISVMGTSIELPVDVGADTRTINVPGLVKIVLNEKYIANNRQVVNAVRITLDPLLKALATADIIISHADAGIAGSCGVGTTNCQPACKVKDFMTGGGFIILPGGAKGTFGFNGGYKPNGLSGHLTFIDHGTDQKIKGTDVTAYTGTGTARQITYVCSISSDGCVLGVADNGEPGWPNVDKFSLTSAPYTVDGPYITKGNIQLHKSSCPATSGGGKPPKGR